MQKPEVVPSRLEKPNIQSIGDKPVLQTHNPKGVLVQTDTIPKNIKNSEKTFAYITAHDVLPTFVSGDAYVIATQDFMPHVGFVAYKSKGFINAFQPAVLTNFIASVEVTTSLPFYGLASYGEITLGL